MVQRPRTLLGVELLKSLLSTVQFLKHAGRLALVALVPTGVIGQSKMHSTCAVVRLTSCSPIEYQIVTSIRQSA